MKKEIKKSIAIVSPLLGTDWANPSCVLCKTIIEKLRSVFDITVLTTCASDDSTWRNDYLEGEQFVDTIHVFRFPVKSERKIKKYSGYHRFLDDFWEPNTEEIQWFINQGPYTPDLCNYLHINYSAFDAILFFDCLSYTTAVCILDLPNAILIPLVPEKKEILYISHFEKIFTQSKGYVFQNQNEQKLIYSLFPVSKEKPYTMVASTTEEFCKLINQINFLKTKKNNDSYSCDTYINRKITPAFDKKNIAVVFSSDDRYAYILSVALQSLIDITNTSWNYDICIVSDGIQDFKKNLFRIICAGKKNISLRFIEISHLLNTAKLNTFNSRLSRTTFARLYIPELFSEYKKVLSLDGDIIIRRDISELYNTEIENFYFAAVPDCGIRYISNFNEYDFKYIKNIGISSVDRYFNAGVLLFNIQEIRKNYSVQKMIKVIEMNKFHFDEQDAFNCFAKDHIKFLKLNWNLFGHVNQVTQDLLLLFPEYREAYNNPYILHYTGGSLPTSVENSRFSEEFWKVARRTPCYESILNLTIRNYNNFAVIKKRKTVIHFAKSFNNCLRKMGLRKTMKYYLYRIKYSSEITQ